MTKKRDAGKTPRSAKNDGAEVQEVQKLLEALHAYLDEKKAEDIRVLDLFEVNPYFKYFMIATATSQIHLKSLVRELRKNFGEFLPDKQSGMRPEDVSSGWVILDFIDIVLHLFLEEQRSYYNLERLWGDAREKLLGK